MHVALIAPPWLPVPPPSYGGTESVVDGLARGLAAAGHAVTLATTGDSTCPVDRTWTFERARTDQLGDSTVEMTHVLHAYAATADADIVHDHTAAGPAIAAARRGPPAVTTNHGLFTPDVRAFYRAVDEQVPVVAISRHHASTAHGVRIARIIHHGIDVDRFPFGTGGDRLAFLGRMSPDKGVRQAIEIARRAGVPLDIAAKMRLPDEHGYFRSEIEPRLGGEVRYLGELGAADKLELLGNARALLNPIRWDEPFGLSMVEALACGTPVIVTRRGAAPEIVDDGTTGFLVSSIDDAVAAVTWARTLDRRACRVAVEARFSVQRMVDDHLALYRDVLGGRARTAA